MFITMKKDAVSRASAEFIQVEISQIQACANQAIEDLRRIEDCRLQKAYLTVFSDAVTEYVLKDFERANVSSSEEIKAWYTRVRDLTELRSRLEPSHQEVWETVASALDSITARLLWNGSNGARTVVWQFL